MNAKVIKSFSGTEDGTVHPRQIEVGEIVHGELAAAAVSQKWAEEIVEHAVPKPDADVPKPRSGSKQQGKS